VSSLPGLGQLRDRGAEHDYMVHSGVGPGVARAQHPGQHLAGLGDHGQQRVVPEGALVGRCRVLLVGPGAHDRGVEVDDRHVARGSGARGPRRCPGPGTSAGQAPELGRSQPADRAPRGRLRRHRTEQGGLAPHRGEIRHAHRAIGKCHDHLRQGHPRVVETARQVCHRRPQPRGQAAAIGHLAQPHQPRMRHQTLAVTGHRSWPDQPGSLPHRKPSRTGNRMLVVNTHSPSSGGSFASPPNSATNNRG
jgi:hypothetical protein